MPYFITEFTGKQQATTPANEFIISSSNTSLIVSILSAGTFFGALIAGDLAGPSLCAPSPAVAALISAQTTSAAAPPLSSDASSTLSVSSFRLLRPASVSSSPVA
jgi:hypothetical protein